MATIFASHSFFSRVRYILLNTVERASLVAGHGSWDSVRVSVHSAQSFMSFMCNLRLAFFKFLIYCKPADWSSGYSPDWLLLRFGVDFPVSDPRSYEKSGTWLHYQQTSVIEASCGLRVRLALLARLFRWMFPLLFIIYLTRHSIGCSMEQCRVMDSKMRPLWLVWENADLYGLPLPLMYKRGDGNVQTTLTKIYKDIYCSLLLKVE